MAERERQIRIQRLVADKVLEDETIFTTPVEKLSNFQASLLQSALQGPYADEIMAAIRKAGQSK